jgi:hypothetical protein
VLLVACGGCDSLFGFSEVPTAHVDGAIGDGPLADSAKQDSSGDAPPGELRIVLPQAPMLYVGDQVTLQPVIHGPPNDNVTLDASANAGTITPTQSMVMLDGNGIAPVNLGYTAPNTPASVIARFSAHDPGVATLVDLPLTVQDLSSVGLDAAQTKNQGINPGDAIGIKITLTTAVIVRDLGIHVPAASGGNVRFALYTAGSTSPNTFVVAAAAAPVAIGRNVVPVSPTQLTPGDYWLLAVFDQATLVDWIASGLYGTESFPYASQWPAPWNLQFVEVGNTTFAMFMLVEQ